MSTSDDDQLWRPPSANATRTDAASTADEPPPAVDDREDGEADPAAVARPEFTAVFGTPDQVGRIGLDRSEAGRFGQAAADGQILDRRQKGMSDDVLVTLLAHPALAAERAVTGDALRASRRLDVRIDARRSERRDIVWDASLRTVLWMRRAARLRLYGSASMNVTVLTLAPSVGRRRPSRWFVRAGNRAMGAVVEALERDLADLRWQPRRDDG